MTIPFAAIFRTLLADLAARDAAGRLDGDDVHATSILVAMTHAIASGPDTLAGLSMTCVMFDLDHPHRPEVAPPPPHLLGARGPGAIVTDDDGDAD